jgi:nicotinamidase-related amidase
MKAVLVIDMLNDFVTGKLKCERAQAIIPNIKRLLEAARAKGYPVVFSNDAHRPEGDKEFEIWGPHAIVGTKGAQVIPELPVQQKDYVVPKRRYSGFQGTDLDMFLQENGVDEVVLTGLHTNICVRHTSADAFYNNYKVTVPEDAVGAFTEKDQTEGLAYLKQVYGAQLCTTEQLVQEWQK